MCCCASSSTSRASATRSMTTPSLDAAQSLDAAFITAITSLGWAAGLPVEVQHDVHGVGRWQRRTNVWRRTTSPSLGAARLRRSKGACLSRVVGLRGKATSAAVWPSPYFPQHAIGELK